MNEKLSEKIGNIRVKRPQTLALLINNMISAGSRQQSKLYKIDLQKIREIIFFIFHFLRRLTYDKYVNRRTYYNQSIKTKKNSQFTKPHRQLNVNI